MNPSDAIRAQIYTTENLDKLKKEIPHFRNIKYAVTHQDTVKINVHNQYLKKKITLRKSAKINKCTNADMLIIEEVLLEEKNNHPLGSGFWHNLNILKEKIKEIWVYKIDNQIIGLCMTSSINKFSPVIFWIKKEEQRLGYGSDLLDRIEKKAIKKNVDIMHVQFLDETREFWIKKGYTPRKTLATIQTTLSKDLV